MRKALFPGLLPALALCAPLSAHAAEYWVGTGSGCDFQAIQPAIEAARATPEADTLRIARNGTYANQALEVSTSVALVGGYPTCGAMDREGYTALTGNQKEAVLRISRGDPAGIEVHIDRLDISEGGRDAGTPLWGGLWILGNARVHLRDSVVRENHGGKTGSGTLSGGGITVHGAQAELVIERWVDIRENTVRNLDSAGGGILVNGGTLRIRPHGVTIKQNEAFSHAVGGGIAVVNGGQMEVAIDPNGMPLPVEGVLVGHNRTDASGNCGGIYVGGAGSQLFASNLLIDHNTSSDRNSGGLCVVNEGYARLDAQFDTAPSRRCPPWQECLSLSHNRGVGSGAALYVAGGGSVHLDGVAVRGNGLDATSSASSANAFQISGDNSVLTLVNSLVADNTCASSRPDCAVVETFGGKLYLAHVTFARNGNEGGALIHLNAYGGSAGTGSVVDAKILSSLIADKEKTYAVVRSSPPIPSTTLDIRCVLKNRGTPGGHGAVAPITFRDAAAGNYRLAPGNLAIDYCDGGVAAPWSRNPDLDRQARGVDDPDHPNRDGIDAHSYDLGAYEFRAVYDRLFADGFDATP